ncbi:lipopolysaccharide biosynthesis protein, partial [Gemella morbillorum]
MKQDSKIKNVTRNTILGVFNNIALVLLNLISRKLFLNYIGIEYLSVGQVINNILGILAFSELGVANSVLYLLYKPVAQDDTKKIAKIIGSYKKINRVIGCVIFGLGLVCVPFLNRFIQTSISMKTVYLVFIMNLLYSSSTYFCSYRQVLINANQKNYIVSKVSLFVNFFGILIQCAIIYLTHSYVIYLAVLIIMGLIQNIIIFRIAGRWYPYLKEFRKCKLGERGYKELVNTVKSMFAVKFCAIVINNTDNLLVSLISTLMVGYCANYTIVTVKINSIIAIFHNSTVYSLGIASVEKSAEEKLQLFKKILYINSFLAGATTILLGVLLDDFIVFWLGEKYLISRIVFYSLLLSYMWNIITATIWMFRDTNGLFVYVKRMLFLNAVLNIILSFIFGKLIGVSGVYFATIISNIFTDFWYDAKLVFKKLFHKNKYWHYNFYVLFNVLVVFIITIGINSVFKDF